MEYRQLGRSGLRVSTITLGTMGFGGTGWATPVGQIDVEGARRQIGLARDAGVNLFDTADVYSGGTSEEILGQALGSSRDQGLGILVWSPIAGGLLSGKYRRGVEAPAGSRHLGEWSEPPVHDEEKLYNTIEKLVEIGEGHGVSAAQVALAYLLA